MAKTKKRSVTDSGTSAVAHLLGGTSRARLVRLLTLEATAPLHLREIARRSGVGLGILQRELKEMEAFGLITRQARGRQVEFALNADHELVPPLAALCLTFGGGWAAAIRRALNPVATEIRAAALLPRNGLGGGWSVSLELCVVGEIAYAEVAARCEPLQRIAGTSLRITVLRLGDLQRLGDMQRALSDPTVKWILGGLPEPSAAVTSLPQRP